MLFDMMLAPNPTSGWDSDRPRGGCDSFNGSLRSMLILEVLHAMQPFDRCAKTQDNRRELCLNSLNSLLYRSKHGSNLTCENSIQRRNLLYGIWSLARHLLGPSHTTLPMVQAHRVSPADHLQLPIASRPPDLTSASVGVGILRAVAEMKRISALCSSWRVGEGREAQSDFGSGPSGAGQAGPMPDKRRQRSEPSAAAVRPS